MPEPSRPVGDPAEHLRFAEEQLPNVVGEPPVLQKKEGDLPSGVARGEVEEVLVDPPAGVTSRRVGIAEKN